MVAHRAHDFGLVGFPLVFQLAPHADQTAQDLEKDAPSQTLVEASCASS